MKMVDIGPLLDEGRWIGYQKPASRRRPPIAHARVGSAARWVCVRAGDAIARIIGDRLGRRVALPGSVFVFGALTCAISFV